MKPGLALIAALWLLVAPAVAQAHEIRPAFLELKQTAADTFDVLWKVPARGDLRLGLYVRFDADTVHKSEPRGMFSGGAYVERWSVSHPEGLVGTRIYIDGLKTTLTDVMVRIERLDGSTQVARLMPERADLVVEASPGAGQVMTTYLNLGIEHILLGIDHLLFVLGLLLLSRGFGLLIKTITAFTVGHSVSLALATLGVVSVPAKPLSAAIALSIVFLAAELVRARKGQSSLTIRNPWLVSFGFGLLHGLGFAGALTALGLPAAAIPVALLFFNVGVEIGQILFVAVALALLASFRKLDLRLPVWAKPVPLYAMGSIAAFWFAGRLASMF